MAGMPETGRQRSTHGGDWAMHGGAVFAGVALTVSGSLSVLQGATGIAKDSLFSPPGYAYRFDLPAWGWIHLVIGVLLLTAGIGVLLGKAWGRGGGIAFAGSSLIAQFMFVPYYPVWSIIVMVFDLLIVWSLSRAFHPATGSGG
ncbi:hypothetical protein [Streptomyces sp. NPDC014733]|uniref:DUF7144 family membrane protein n=1 Tax=Streptomyces sp. NPDC014733 TaxID=3364885 RepID=UPI0036F6944F